MSTNLCNYTINKKILQTNLCMNKAKFETTQTQLFAVLILTTALLCDKLFKEEKYGTKFNFKRNP